MKRGHYKPFWVLDNGDVEIIDQRLLPFEEKTVILKSADDAIHAIKDMAVRGAGVIGNIAAFGVYLALRECESKASFLDKAAQIRASRPTAVNLMWAVDRMLKVIDETSYELANALDEAILISDEDVKRSLAIGNFGADIIESIMKEKNLSSINVLTHCNAGWLAIVDSGTALAPFYEAHNRGIDIHVWVDETRPRNQGANLTAWELGRAGVKHTIIPDNTGGHLMQHDLVDMVITGADRVTRNGDAANKIGTYLKALAANDNKIPFYIALPESTFDFETVDGVTNIEIEERSADEVHIMRGTLPDGTISELRVTPPKSHALNIGFDVTPARLITGLITERGVVKADQEAIETMYKDLL